MSLSEKELSELRALYYKGLSHCYVNVKERDGEKALQYLNKAAQGGFADAYYVLGDIYLYGFTGAQQAQQALDAYLKGHNLQSAKCAYGLAALTEGEQSASLATQAFDALFEEAGQGDEISQYIVAAYFSKGLGCQEVNLSAYFYWLKESALSGCVYAMQELADCYRDGFCVPQNLEKANEWYKKGGLSPIEALPQNIEKSRARHVIMDSAEEEGKDKAQCQRETSVAIAPDEKDLHAEEHSNNNKIYNALGERSGFDEGQEAGQGAAKEEETLSARSQTFERDAAKEGEFEQDFEQGAKKEKIFLKIERDFLGSGLEQGDALKEVSQATGLPEKEYNEKRPLEFLLVKADMGDAEAMTQLALRYEKGEDVEQNYDEAAKWYVKAAQLEDARAQNNLGLYYEKGIGVERNPFKAASFYKKAALADYAPAKYNLAICHIEGIGVKKSYPLAARFLEEASSMNYAPAHFILGALYQSGKGVEKDLAKAADLYGLAYEGGIKDALVNKQLCLTLLERES